MKLEAPPVIVLSGAGGGSPNVEPFRAGFGEATNFVGGAMLKMISV